MNLIERCYTVVQRTRGGRASRLPKHAPPPSAFAGMVPALHAPSVPRSPDRPPPRAPSPLAPQGSFWGAIGAHPRIGKQPAFGKQFGNGSLNLHRGNPVARRRGRGRGRGLQPRPFFVVRRGRDGSGGLEAAGGMQPGARRGRRVRRGPARRLRAHLGGRGLNSFTSQLNLSDVYGIGGARRGCVARVKGYRVLGACRVFLCDRHGSS